MSVRVRYAPSPTGAPHVGNIRDALFKHWFARHHGGVNILRIEDTDRTRYIPGCEEEIVESLRWIGVEFQEGFGIGGDNGPYRQSERKEAGIYEREIAKLLDSGNAYWAFDTPEELAEMREYQQLNKQPIGYFGGLWRDASATQVEQARAAGKPGVVRLRIPRGETIFIHDAIRGRIEWNSDDVDDPVLIKADGMPTYHFAAMVDDHLMGITHIMRGEEWISSAPKHKVLFDAFGWEAPIFVHCPVIKGKDGKKLSKRHGDTRCLDYRDAGYLPQALANFITLIGWAPGGDREIMSPDEIAEAFTLDGLQPAPGVFDLDKLRWMNGHYVRALRPSALVEAVRAYVQLPGALTYWSRPTGDDPEAGPRDPAIVEALPRLREGLAQHPDYVAQAIALEQERVVTLADFAPAIDFFLLDEPPMDAKAVDKWFGQPHVRDLFDTLVESLTGREAISVDECEALLRDYAAANAFDKLGPVVHPTRVALTGKTVGPGLFELMSLLGPARMVLRFERALALVAERS